MIILGHVLNEFTEYSLHTLKYLSYDFLKPIMKQAYNMTKALTNDNEPLNSRLLHCKP